MRTRVAVALLALLGSGGVAAVVHGWGSPTVPAQYRALIIRSAASCPGLGSTLLAAQIQQESGWDPRASSRTGAQGIAQFMPAEWSAYGVDGNADGVKDVWNPVDAIPSAARFDCVLLQDVAGVPGDPRRNMLAAYNAGPDQVLRYRGVPPFQETRAYVQQVLARAAVLVIGPT